MKGVSAKGLVLTETSGPLAPLWRGSRLVLRGACREEVSVGDEAAEARRDQVHASLSDDPPPLEGRAEDAVNLAPEEPHRRGDDDEGRARADCRVDSRHRREDPQDDPPGEPRVDRGPQGTPLPQEGDR